MPQPLLAGRESGKSPTHPLPSRGVALQLVTRPSRQAHRAQPMLNSASLVGFVATAQEAAAKQFYESVLGLVLLEDTPFALVLNSNGSTLRVQKVKQFSAAPYTALGWAVPDIQSAVRALAAKGVVFQRYDGMSQDELGIWQSPSGVRVAWFHDPDGNTLSLTESAT
jgi:catechol 2,3-dioxygenase-like lactoylglutathione lyase family enzyme